METKSEQTEEEDSEKRITDMVDTLKEAVKESRAVRTPEVCILHDLRSGLCIELHSLKQSIGELTSLTLDTLGKMKDNNPKGSLSMVS